MFMRFFLILALAFICANTAQAGEIVACGVPTVAGASNQPSDNTYCDIHQRRLGYREQSLEHTKQIQERQKNYIAPQIEAVNKYKSDLESLNASRGGPTQSAQSTEEAELQLMLQAEEASRTP
jgi:hypothetical protein